MHVNLYITAGSPIRRFEYTSAITRLTDTGHIQSADQLSYLMYHFLLQSQH